MQPKTLMRKLKTTKSILTTLNDKNWLDDCKSVADINNVLDVLINDFNNQITSSPSNPFKWS